MDLKHRNACQVEGLSIHLGLAGSGEEGDDLQVNKHIRMIQQGIASAVLAL